MFDLEIISFQVRNDLELICSVLLIVFSDISENRLQMAQNMGADFVVHVKTRDPQQVADQVHELHPEFVELACGRMRNIKTARTIIKISWIDQGSRCFWRST